MSITPPPWLGEHKLALEGCARLVLGPLEIQAYRAHQQWRVLARREPEDLPRGPLFELPYTGPELERPVEVQRYGFRESPEALRIALALADRPVIIRPDIPFTLLPGEEVRAYVSSPLWVQTRVTTEGQERVLLDTATYRPSDTWFGRDTRDGLLCYAGTSRLRLAPNPEETPGHRATTPVVLRNRGEEPMGVVRIRLPVRHLSLFLGPGGSLWTERLTMTHRAGESNDTIEVDHEPPRESAGGPLLTPPRQPQERTFVARAFESVFRVPTS